MIKNKQQEPNKKTSQTIKRKYVAILPHLFTLSHCLKVAESKESEQRWRSEIRARIQSRSNLASCPLVSDAGDSCLQINPLAEQRPVLLGRTFHRCCFALSRFSRVCLCSPMDCSPPGSSGHGILQARILEWVAMPSCRGSPRPRDGSHISYVSCIGRQLLYDWHCLEVPTFHQGDK